MHLKPQPYSRYATEVYFKRKIHRKDKKNLCDFEVITAYMQKYSKSTVKDEFCCMENQQRTLSTQLKMEWHKLYKN